VNVIKRKRNSWAQSQRDIAKEQRWFLSSNLLARISSKVGQLVISDRQLCWCSTLFVVAYLTWAYRCRRPDVLLGYCLAYWGQRGPWKCKKNPLCYWNRKHKTIPNLTLNPFFKIQKYQENINFQTVITACLEQIVESAAAGNVGTYTNNWPITDRDRARERKLSMIETIWVCIGLTTLQTTFGS